MKDIPNDGRYYADGRTVQRAPLTRKTESGRSISMGFPVCMLSDYVGDDAAQIIADALNDAMARATRSDAP